MTDDFHQLLVLMVVIWTSGKLFRCIKLPVVFGELIGGIIVGPTLLNIVQADTEMIKTLAELGIFFLMLHSGMHTDPHELFHASKKSFGIALGGVVFPFLGGYIVSILAGQSFESAMFIGMCLCISALSLIVHQLKDCKMLGTPVANITLGASLIDDILALILFSAILNVVDTGSFDPIQLAAVVGKISIFFAIVLIGGQKTAPVLNKFIYFGNKGFTLTLIIALCLGLIAEAIGLHMIIGAFLAGLFIQEEMIDQKTFDKIEDRVYGLSYSFFGPIFFASHAFHLDFPAVAAAPWFLTAIIVVAILGKIIGCGGTALALGMSKAESALIGLSLNNRGAVEIIIAAIGLSYGIIDSKIFSILILMAFCSTIFSICFTGRVARQIKALDQ